MTVYLVQKLHWEYNDSWHDMVGDTPVKAFVSREDAEQLCATLEREERQRWRGPDDFGGIARCTTGVTEAAVLEQLAAFGLPLPPEKHAKDHRGTSFTFLDLREWWQRLLPWQRDLVWELLDRVRFYEVLAVELEP